MTVELVAARVRAVAARRLAWFRERQRRDADLDPIAQILACHDALAEELRFGSPVIDAIDAQRAAIEQALAGDDGRFGQLVRVFGLEPAEADLLATCLAIAVDPPLARVLAALDDAPHRCYVTEPIVARMFRHGPRGICTPESPLARWRLVEATYVGAGEPEALALDPAIRDWLLGASRLPARLVGVVRTVPLPIAPWPPAALVDDAVARADAALEAGRTIRLQLIGPPRSGRRTTAAAIAERLGLPAIAIDCDAIDDLDWPLAAMLATRQAFLDRRTPVWITDARRRGFPPLPAAFPVEIIVTEQPIAQLDQLAMPAPSAEQRAALWRALVPGAATWGDEVERLAGRFRVNIGDLVEIGARTPADAAAAGELVRGTTRGQLGELAEWLDCTFDWDDLVIPDRLRRNLQDLVFEAEQRLAFWERREARRLFPHGRGVIAMFAGGPGTGKTMAAQVIARALGLDLFRISLSSVISKYVGETAQNLQRLLSRAARLDAVLLFDEADALFGKRTEIKDAHDRYANIDTGHLLQAIEAYPGVALLATNKKANVDPAFTRRLRHVLEFARPELAQRDQLWRRLVGELAPERAELVLRELGDLAAIECTGAQIKYAVLAAVLAARQDRTPLAAAHLWRGLDRELAKDGRSLSEHHRGALHHA